MTATSIRDTSIWTPGNQYPVPTYSTPQVFPGFGDVQLLSVDRLRDLPTDTDFIATYQLTGAAIDTDFFDVLSTSCGDGVTCNFADTAKVRFILPSNVTFTSDSGVFLTQIGGVPEPATWTVMLMGFGGLGALLRSAPDAGRRDGPRKRSRSGGGCRPEPPASFAARHRSNRGSEKRDGPQPVVLGRLI